MHSPLLTAVLTVLLGSPLAFAQPDAPAALAIEAPAAPAEAGPVETSPPPPNAPPPSLVPTESAPLAQSQRLVSGAPIYNPNVAVHIVEKKQFSDAGAHELALYPAAVQANGKFTQHVGTAVSYTYHLHENFGLQLTPQYNWYATESQLNRELIDKVRQEAQAATSLLLVWGINAGVEVTPLYGKFAFYQGSLGHFAIVLNAGAGLGSTKHQITPANSGVAESFGDTGLKFLGSVGGGARVLLGDRFALRFEVRDLVYTARVDSVNGCKEDDLQAADTHLGQGGTLEEAPVSGGCRVTQFGGDDPRGEINRSISLIQKPTSDVLSNVGFYAGFAFIF